MKITIQHLWAIAGASLLVACGGSEPTRSKEANEAISTPHDSADMAEAGAETTPEEAAPTADAVSLADFTPDVAHGETLFIQCQTCHVIEDGVNRVGPSLAGVIGRTAGSVEGFSYSSANADSGIVWTPEEMFRYLENPRAVIPGTSMIFVGFPDGQDRADLIAYLQANGG